MLKIYKFLGQSSTVLSCAPRRRIIILKRNTVTRALCDVISCIAVQAISLQHIVQMILSSFNDFGGCETICCKKIYIQNEKATLTSTVLSKLFSRVKLQYLVVYFIDVCMTAAIGTFLSSRETIYKHFRYPKQRVFYFLLKIKNNLRLFFYFSIHSRLSLIFL